MDALFLRILNLSITASYIVLAVLVLRLVLRRAPKWMLCALWALVAVRLACPFSLESALSLIPSTRTVNPAIVEAADSLPAEPVIQSGFAIIDERANEALTELTLPRLEPIDPADSLVEEPQDSVIISAVAVATILWLCGMAAMVLYGLGSFLMLRHRVRMAVRLKGDLWQSEAVTTPFVLGLIRPRIYLPFAMDRVTAGPVIAHERAHIRRHDPLWKLLGYILLSVYWFDPLLWLAYTLFCKDIELACDENVVRNLTPDARRQYATALLSCGVNRPGFAACPVAFGEVGVKERIKRVMKYKKPALWAVIFAAALCLAAAVCLLTDPAADAAIMAESPTFSAAHTQANDEPSEVPYALPVTNPAQAPDPIPILQIRPRDISAEEAKTVVTALFGDADIYQYSGELTKAELAETIAGWEERLSDREGIVADVGVDPDEYIAEFTPLLEAYKAAYETASDVVEPKLTDWTFHSHDYFEDQGRSAVDDGSSSTRWIRATAEVNDLLYNIWVINYNAEDEMENYRTHCVDVFVDDLIIPREKINLLFSPTQEDIDWAYVQAERLLDQMGIENYAITDYEIWGVPNASLTVYARPVYDGTPLLGFYRGTANAASSYYDGCNIEEESIAFRFNAGRLIGFDYSSPHEVVASKDLDVLLSLEDALETAGLSDRLEEDWQFGYVRVPIGDGTEDFQLIPVYCSKARVSSVAASVTAVSAVDGTCLTGGDVAAPAEADDPQLTELPYSTDVSPTPPASVGETPSEIEVRWGPAGAYNYVETGYFNFPAGESLELCAIWYPNTILGEVEWWVDDESVVSIAPREDTSGIYCGCTMVGQPGESTVMHVSVNGKEVIFVITIS